VLKKFILKNPFQLFLAILLPFLVGTLLLLFVQSSLLTYNFQSFALEMVYKQQRTDLQNTSRNLDIMEQSIRSAAITAFFDSAIKDLLYSDIELEDYGKYINKLETYKNIHPFLQSIYIYNGESVYAVPNRGFKFDSHTFEDQGIISILKDFKDHRSHSVILRKIPNILYGISSEEEYINVYTYLFFDSQVENGKVEEALIFNISEKELKKSITSSNSRIGSRLFIVDPSGKLLSDDSEHPVLSDLSENNYIKKILSSKDKTGNFRMEVNGIDSFITYLATDVFNWRLISITAYDDIVKGVEQMKQKTSYLVLVFVIGNILLVFYLSRRLYRPVKQVIENYKILESEKKNEFYYRKQNFLQKMVHVNDVVAIKNYYKKFNKYNIDLEPRDPYLLILIKLDHYLEFSTKYDLSDRNLLKFGIINIVSELLGEKYKFECIEMDEDQILVLVSYSLSKSPSRDTTLISLVKDIQSNTEKFLKISISMTCSEVFPTLHNLGFHYAKTLDASHYRLIFGHQSIIFNESIQVRTDEYKYPIDLDRKLINAVVQGRFEEASNALSGIVQSASDSAASYTIINSTIIRMLLSIRQAIEVLEANHSIKVNFNFNAYMTRLQNIETLEEVHSDFNTLFKRLSLQLESTKDNKQIKLIEDVTAIIYKDFANPLLSLDSIADQVNLSPAYLGKLYKKHCLITVTDLINNVRLTFAAEQMIVANDTVNVVMEKSGFLSRSHFFTLFKKAYGITPGEYRNKSKNTDLRTDA